MSWYNQSLRHKLASHGIKTTIDKDKSKKSKINLKAGDKILYGKSKDDIKELKITSLLDEYQTLDELCADLDDRIQKFYDVLSNYYDIESTFYVSTTDRTDINPKGGMFDDEIVSILMPFYYTNFETLMHEFIHVLQAEKFKEKHSNDSYKKFNELYEDDKMNIENRTMELTDEMREKWIDLYDELGIERLQRNYYDIVNDITFVKKLDKLGHIHQKIDGDK